MRDALSILDQAIAFGADELTLEHVLSVTGSVGRNDFLELTNYIVEHDIQSAFKLYHRLLSEGKEVTRLVNDLIYFLRDVIMDYAAGEKGDAQIYQLDVSLLYEMIDKINDTLVSMRFAVNTNVHFEVLIVKLAELVKRSNVHSTPRNVVRADTSHLEKRILQRNKLQMVFKVLL